jgi:hypothetical protein
MKTSQIKRIIGYIKDTGSITPLEALREFGIMRLASRICDIKKMGINIKSEYVSSVNRYGEKIKYKEYWIEG